MSLQFCTLRGRWSRGSSPVVSQLCFLMAFVELYLWFFLPYVFFLLQMFSDGMHNVTCYSCRNTYVMPFVGNSRGGGRLVSPNSAFWSRRPPGRLLFSKHSGEYGGNSGNNKFQGETSGNFFLGILLKPVQTGVLCLIQLGLIE